MSEWKDVYQLVFSENLVQQKEGLDRLVCWKARCPSLPAVVECTLEIFQVLVEDPEQVFGTPVSVAQERQLRLMYSTAVMRFLNLMVDVKNDEDVSSSGSMYMRAGKLSIPEWIVNLRHDAAHGTSLPDLFLLRAAAKFIAEWLHTNYWQREDQIASDWYASADDVLASSSDQVEIGHIMETWQALSLYKIAGFENMRQISDPELQGTLNSILKPMEDENLKPRSAKLSSLLGLWVKRLARLCRTGSTCIDKAALLANILVGGEFFLPSEDLMNILYPEGLQSEGVFHQLPAALVKHLADLINTLWDLGAVPALCKRLILVSSDPKEPDLRRNFAALWLQKLILSCLKVREAQKLRCAIRDRLDCKAIFDHFKGSCPGANRNAIITLLAFAHVENQRPNDLKLGYMWKILPVPNELTSINLIKQAIEPCPKFSSIYLPCLMELAAMPLASRTLLMESIDIYNGTSPSLSNLKLDSKIYSAIDFTSIASSEGIGAHSCNQAPKSSSDSTLEKVSRWSLSQGHLEWHKCPLGVLPWHREVSRSIKEVREDTHQRAWTKLYVDSSEWTEISPPKEQLRNVKAGRVCRRTLAKTPVERALRHLFLK